MERFMYIALSMVFSLLCGSLTSACQSAGDDYNSSQNQKLQSTPLVSIEQLAIPVPTIRIDPVTSTAFLPTPTVYNNRPEVNQAIQTFNETADSRCSPTTPVLRASFCNNAVPMVTGRATYIGVYLKPYNYQPFRLVNFILRVSLGNTPLVEKQVSVTGEVATQLSQKQFHDQRFQTPNIHFVLTKEESLKLVGLINFQVYLKLEDIPEFKVAATDLLFRRTKNLHVFFQPIEIKGETPDYDAVAYLYWMERLLPVAKITHETLPPIIGADPVNKPDQTDQLNEIAAKYFDDHGYDPNTAYQFFGWLPKKYYNGGSSDAFWCNECPGRHLSQVGFGGAGSDINIEGPRILVHEISHNLGTMHAYTPTTDDDSNCFWDGKISLFTDPAWPYDMSPHTQQLGVDLTNPAQPVLKSDHSYDYMAWCMSFSWTSPHTYATAFYGPILRLP
jgi:hypothetical protein